MVSRAARPAFERCKALQYQPLRRTRLWQCELLPIPHQIGFGRVSKDLTKNDRLAANRSPEAKWTPKSGWRRLERWRGRGSERDVVEVDALLSVPAHHDRDGRGGVRMAGRLRRRGCTSGGVEQDIGTPGGRADSSNPACNQQVLSAGFAAGQRDRVSPAPRHPPRARACWLLAWCGGSTCG